MAETPEGRTGAVSGLSLVAGQRTRTGRQRVGADECAVYTVREVAHLLSLSTGVTYALIRKGEIPARRLGGRWVIPRARFIQWLDSCEDDEPLPVPPWSGTPSPVVRHLSTTQRRH